jgi:cytochrome c oxidase cbb3-type subunit 3
MKTRNHKLVFLILAVLSQTGYAQAPATTGASNTVAPAAATEVADIMMWGIGIVVMLILAFALFAMARSNRYLSNRVLQFEAAKNGVILPGETTEIEPEGDDFWTRMRKKYWEDAVPIEREGEITLNHAYDGIRELDNRLPPWWINMFAITVVWAVGYMYFYHWSGNNWSSGDEYKTEMETAKKEVAMALVGKANSVDESNATAMTDATALGEGEIIFKSVCAACHGQKGEGLVGPNFTDAYWIHGGGIKNIFKTVKYGVLDKGMISWQSQLKPVEIQKVSSYILSLSGTNPPNPKAPQGTIWADSTAVQNAAVPAVK